MYPDFPIFNRKVYGSGFTNSFYDPQTLITKLVAPEFDYHDKNDFFNKSFEYNATSVHERLHWLQHHGTSFGCFLGALRLSQQSTTLRTLREESSDQIELLLEQRNSGDKSILNLDPETRYPDFKSDSKLMNLFSKIWFDHQWVYKIFEDSRFAEQKPGQIPGNAIGEVVSDVMIALKEYGFSFTSSQISLRESLESRKWFSMDDSEMFLVTIFKMRLTSKLIMESPALISEIQLLSVQGSFLQESDKKKAIENRIRIMVDGDYGIPIRCLLRVLNIDLNGLQNILPTVSIICFIALNPPLPPYVTDPPENSSSWKWQDIYPPIRFARLLHCVQRIGLLGNRSNHEEIFEYIMKICELCNLPHTINECYPGRKDSENFNFSNPDNVFKDIFKSYDYRKFSHNDYIFWVQSRLAEYRTKALPLLVNFGDCMSGDLLRKYCSDMIVFDDIPFHTCPLMWTSNDQVGFSCSSDFGNWLLLSVAVDYVLFDVVVGKGKYDLSAFPKEIRESDEFHDSLVNSVRINLTGSNR